MNFFPDFAQNSRKEWRLSLFNQFKQCREDARSKANGRTLINECRTSIKNFVLRFACLCTVYRNRYDTCICYVCIYTISRYWHDTIHRYHINTDIWYILIWYLYMYILVLEYTVYGIYVLLWYRYEVAQLAAQLQIFLVNINIEKCTAANISSVLIWYLCMVSCHTYLWCKYCTHIFNIAARNIEYNCAFFMFRMQQVSKRSEIENNLVNQC